MAGGFYGKYVAALTDSPTNNGRECEKCGKNTTMLLWMYLSYDVGLRAYYKYKQVCGGTRRFIDRYIIVVRSRTAGGRKKEVRSWRRQGGSGRKNVFVINYVAIIPAMLLVVCGRAVHTAQNKRGVLFYAKNHAYFGHIIVSRDVLRTTYFVLRTQ